ncbi:predicted protein [Sclerotinia sclerotiorum 1980 UF-70]|uniref:Uncharacterized protein n=1 Tax=Sclerotinia sclerotiorum (strain ATCC 18683 / 1980 / Ss-1) TaxID=665079 RepID=A7EM15_SCLS1|nr:predicted protein [Sclerotinia sclerotiorum 1980 UF-70]EDO03881.1 predicted protein [Sclerotinia sclerotiorum 1980 UF-70]
MTDLKWRDLFKRTTLILCLTKVKTNIKRTSAQLMKVFQNRLQSNYMGCAHISIYIMLKIPPRR